MATQLGDAFVRVRPDTKTFASETARGVDSASHPVVSKMGTIAKRAGLALGAAGLYGAAAFTKNAIQLEAEFGRTMNVLQATTGAPKADMKALSALALKMGADTVFSASDASQAMLELARGGMTAATIQGGALKGTLTLAAAGQLEMGEAANIAVRAMGAFGLKGKEMDSVAAALAGAANASSSSVRDLSFFLAQGGLAANSVGFSIQETTGILAAFSNAGLEGSDAGTSMKTMLDRLVPSTDKAQTAMKGIGLFTKETGSAFVKSNGEFKSATQIAGLLHKATDDLSASERKKAISTIFGSDAQRAATVLAKEGAAGLKPLIKATSDQSAADRQAQANMKGTAGAIERMKGSVETASLAWGMAIKPITKFGANLVAEIANGAVPIIQDFGDHMRNMLKGVDLSGGIKQLMGSIDIGAMFERIGNAVRGVNWNAIGASFSDLGSSIKESKDPLGPFNNLLDVTGTVLKFVADHTDLLAKALPYLAAGFVAIKAAQLAAHAAAAISVPVRIAEVVATRAQTKAIQEQTASRAGGVAATTATTVATGASTASTAANSTAVATNTGMTVRQRIATIASSVATKAAAAASAIWTGAQWLLNAALTANPIGIVVVAIAALVGGLILAYKKSETFRKIVTGAFDAVVGFIKSHWKPILAILTGPIGAAVLFITHNWDKISAGAEAVLGFIRSHWQTILAILTGPIGAAVLAITKHWDGLMSYFRGIPAKIKGFFSGAGKMLLGIGGDIVDGLINGIQGAAHKVLDAALSLVDKIPGPIRKIMGISSPSKVMHKIGDDIGQGLADGLKKKLDDAEQLIRDHAARVKDQLSKLKSTAGDFASTVAGNFQGDIFAGGLKEFRDQLKTDKANAEFFTAALKEAQKKGLSGKLFQEIAASGNLQIAQEFTHLSRTDIGRQEKLFASRNKAAAGAGQFAASTTFGSDIRDTTQELRGLRADLKHFLREKREIVVNDRSGHPRQTAREVARLTAFAGGS